MSQTSDFEQTQSPVIEANNTPSQAVEEQPSAAVDSAEQAGKHEVKKNQEEAQPGREILIELKDDSILPMPLKAAKCSGTWSNMLKDIGDELDEAIPCSQPRKAMEKVIEWCIHHQDDEPTGPETEEGSDRTEQEASAPMDPWDKKFLQLSREELFEVVIAANYLDIKLLIHNCCRTIAHWICGMSPEETRAYFNLENDFTSEEEEEIRRENAWAEK